MVGCLTSQQHASVSQGQICSDNCTCCHTETEVADQTFYLTQSPYNDTRPTSPSADPITPGAWQGSHRSVKISETVLKRSSTHVSLESPISETVPETSSIHVSLESSRQKQTSSEKFRDTQRERVQNIYKITSQQALHSLTQVNTPYNGPGDSGREDVT